MIFLGCGRPLRSLTSECIEGVVFEVSLGVGVVGDDVCFIVGSWAINGCDREELQLQMFSAAGRIESSSTMVLVQQQVPLGPQDAVFGREPCEDDVEVGSECTETFSSCSSRPVFSSRESVGSISSSFSCASNPVLSVDDCEFTDFCPELKSSSQVT